MRDRAQGLRGFLEHFHDVGLDGHIGLDGDRLRSLGLHGGHDLLRLRVARAVVDGDAVAAGCRNSRSFRTDARGTAGDEKNLGHPLIAPPVKPLTRYRRTTKEKTSTGNMIIVPPAAMRPHSQPS